jgi:hypothetical protein
VPGVRVLKQKPARGKVAVIVAWSPGTFYTLRSREDLRDVLAESRYEQRAAARVGDEQAVAA